MATYKLSNFQKPTIMRDTYLLSMSINTTRSRWSRSDRSNNQTAKNIFVTHAKNGHRVKYIKRK